MTFADPDAANVIGAILGTRGHPLQIISRDAGVFTGARAAEQRGTLAPIRDDGQILVADLRDIDLDAAVDSRSIVIAVATDQALAYPAYQRGVAAFLLPPISSDQWDQALRRAAEIVTGRRACSSRRHSHLRFTVARRQVSVLADDVEWIEAASPWLIVHTSRGPLRTRDRLNRIAALLDPTKFLRVHRRALVRSDRIAEVIVGERGDRELRLVGGGTVRLSRRRVSRALKVLA